MERKGVLFCDHRIEPVQVAWEPKLFLSSSDQVSITSQCIQKIETLRGRDPTLANSIDAHMTTSVKHHGRSAKNSRRKKPFGVYSGGAYGWKLL